MPPTHESAARPPALVPALPAGAAAAALQRHWEEARPVAVLDPRAPAARARTHRERLERTPLPAGAALVVASSGTTGAPRLVVHHRSRVSAAAAAVNAGLAVDRDRDRWLACVPLHGVAGLAIVVRAAVAGVPVTAHDRFDVDEVARAAGSCTLVSLVATQLRRLLDAGAPIDRFRAVLLGGGPAPADLVERARDAGAEVHTTYGLTETFGGCVHDGLALPGVELAVDAAGGRGSEGEGEGEILVRGPVMLGYLGDPEATAAAFTADGRLRTGDVGRIDGTGRLTVVDRLKDLVITGGVNVSPTAVEAVLGADPAVGDVAVVGAADPEWGERVVACVVPADPARPPTLAGLRRRAADRLTPAELPRELRVVRTIPRTGSGKPRRAALRVPAAKPEPESEAQTGAAAT